MGTFVNATTRSIYRRQARLWPRSLLGWLPPHCTVCLNRRCQEKEHEAEWANSHGNRAACSMQTCNSNLENMAALLLQQPAHRPRGYHRVQQGKDTGLAHCWSHSDSSNTITLMPCAAQYPVVTDARDSTTAQHQLGTETYDQARVPAPTTGP